MVFTIERRCDRKKNPLFSISREELISILSHKSVSKHVKSKSLKNKKKSELCSLVIDLQKKLSDTKDSNTNQNIKIKSPTKIKSKKNKIKTIKEKTISKEKTRTKAKTKTKKKLKFATKKNLVKEVEINKINKKHLVSKNYEKLEENENAWGELQDCVTYIMSVYNIWTEEEFNEFLNKIDNDDTFAKEAVVLALRKGVLRKDDYDKYTEDEISDIIKNDSKIDELKNELIFQKVYMCAQYFE